MKTQRIAILLTILNLGLLVTLLAFAAAQARRASADTIAPVLRARALEIVDAQGKVRAEILVHGPETVQGKTYPEAVLFRLSDPKGGPLVKMTAAENGAALGLFSDAWGGVQLYAKDTGSYVRVVDKERHEQLLKP